MKRRPRFQFVLLPADSADPIFAPDSDCKLVTVRYGYICTYIIRICLLPDTYQVYDGSTPAALSFGCRGVSVAVVHIVAPQWPFQRAIRCAKNPNNTEYGGLPSQLCNA